MSKMRDQYFADYIAQPYTTKSGKKKVRYVYRGNWNQWGTEGTATKRKLTYMVLELLSVGMFLLASTVQVEFNTVRGVAGWGIISYVPWLLELWGIIRFLMGKTYMTEFDQKSIDWQITMGSLIRLPVLLIAVICGVVAVAKSGSFDFVTFLVVVGHVGSMVVSAVIFRLQRKIGYRSYKNIAGEVGPEN